MSTNAQSGSHRLGKYELRERLGRGGMAEVWKALDPQLQRYVAIKLLHADLQTDPEFILRFSREARMIAALNHPNIVKIFDFQTTSAPGPNMPAAYMVMDFIEGQTLAQLIQELRELTGRGTAACVSRPEEKSGRDTPIPDCRHRRAR